MDPVILISFALAVAGPTPKPKVDLNPTHVVGVAPADCIQQAVIHCSSVKLVDGSTVRVVGSRAEVSRRLQGFSSAPVVATW
ncbi:hypothetical protein [Methylobacterium indicum]|uniref:Uncharacterized protein n=1 Tax=Methylobacterium indicum TaxID=1775910 RepID=A0A8H8X0D8_9HYPH|nr:hypothetical protein [Methylobacterium indicum]BCM87803.1 hypothetical protein mvi_62640 [Methylobacterium indicum]